MRARLIVGCAAALVAGILSAGLLSGCGTEVFSGRASGTATLAGASTRAQAAGQTAQGAVTATGATAAAPQIRVASTTTATQTSTSATSTTATTPLPGAGTPLIQLGDMNTNEQFILGELYDLALTQEGYRVVLSRNIGTTEISQDALAQGSLMLYPEYLNVWDTQVAGSKARFDSLDEAYSAGENYAASKGWALLTPTAFSDTSGIAVSSQYARLNHVYSLASLGRGPSITLGAPLEFAQARSGLPELEAAYGFKPAYVQSINIGDQYLALSQGAIQATYVDTTDPQLASSNYVLLRDPQHVFGFGNVVPVTTDKVISEEGPEFVTIINRVDALLTQSAMRGLNYEVTIEQHDPTQVAQEFLQGNGILPPVRYVPVNTGTTTTTTSTPAGASGS